MLPCHLLEFFWLVQNLRCPITAFPVSCVKRLTLYIQLNPPKGFKYKKYFSVKFSFLLMYKVFCSHLQPKFCLLLAFLYLWNCTFYARFSLCLFSPFFTLLTIHTCNCCCKKCHFNLPLSFLKIIFWQTVKEFFV